MKGALNDLANDNQRRWARMKNLEELGIRIGARRGQYEEDHAFYKRLQAHPDYDLIVDEATALLKLQKTGILPKKIKRAAVIEEKPLSFLDELKKL